MTDQQKYTNLLKAIAEYMLLKGKWDKYHCLSNKEKQAMHNRRLQLEKIIQADRHLID